MSSTKDTVITDFIRHLFPRVVLARNLQLRYTFCLGGLAFTGILLLVFTGLLLVFHYVPSVENAYSSILYLESSVSGGRVIRSLHRVASHSVLCLMFLHLLRVLWTGAFSRPRHLNWVIGCVLSVLVTFEAYSGYLLPRDQFGYWASHTGMELIRAFPGGGLVYGILVPDGVAGPLSLVRFYVLHIIIVPGLVLGLCFLHFYRVRKNKGVLPYL